MAQTYALILAACVVMTLPLEFLIPARVYRRPVALVATLVPVVAVFVAWDVLAVRAGWWTFDPDQTLGVTLPGRLPIEEFLFFVVVPICAVLTYEAVDGTLRRRAGTVSA
ncbi:lycopene cyclase domain-containing protein [Jatrophihabitans fulvus]